MKETPILFNGAMVRAILDGSKTKTRRIVRPQPPRCLVDEDENGWYYQVPIVDRGFTFMDREGHTPCPYGRRGDVLWVRETFYQNGAGDFIYRANYDVGSFNYHLKGWRPSIFMPRVASRITLEIVSIGVERVGDITMRDCKAEGMQLEPGRDTEHLKTDFRTLWDTINAKRGYPWESNCWVWVVEFKRLEAPHDTP